MALDRLNRDGLVLLGCGKMGSALLQGWLRDGLRPEAVWILDPMPSEWLRSIEGLHINENLPEKPAVALIAVKPQMMSDALPVLAPLGNGETLFVTVAAGASIKSYESVLGDRTPIVRAMPNTPAAIGKGITALIQNDFASESEMKIAESLLAAVGQTIWVEDESQMDAVTAVSGSGPAYVFHMIETLAAAGLAEGLPEQLSMRLAIATVAGAGALAEADTTTPEQLRINVTSPAGTTAAALNVLMHQENGMAPLIRQAVSAAADRSRELSN